MRTAMLAWAFLCPAAWAAEDSLKLTQSSVDWKTFEYTLDDGFHIDSFGEKIVTRTFQTYVLENEYVKATLVPEFGGRVISLIYKPTGHEMLYRNPVGVPYGIGKGYFTYDWLMVYGGIFPTLPGPEHGKAWLHPWKAEVTEQSEQAITVKMHWKDDFRIWTPMNFARTRAASGIEADFSVTLRRGSSALETLVQLTNPSPEELTYEYWTNVGLAPGSDPQDPKTTSGAELIVPVRCVQMASWSVGIASDEERCSGSRTYALNNLRWFKNWGDMGIAYASPDMQGKNFWGVINHDNEEGLIRVANNRETPGLKIWTFGYKSTEADVNDRYQSARPFVELWAGRGLQFFDPVSFPAKSSWSVVEHYIPTAGLHGVSAAVPEVLTSARLQGRNVSIQVQGSQPGRTVQVAVLAADTVIGQDKLATGTKAVEWQTTVAPEVSGALSYRVLDESGHVLLQDRLGTL